MPVLFLALLMSAPSFANEILRGESKNLYQEIPDVSVRTVSGQIRKLSAFWSEKPVLLTFFYRTCSGTCSPFLSRLREAVDEQGGLGEQYQILTLSFDPNDTPDDLKKTAASLDLEGEPSWQFAVSDPSSIQRISEATGFWFKKTGNAQFDHPSLIAAIRDGKVMQILLGTDISRARMRDLIYEVRGVFVPFFAIPGKDTLFRCFQIDAKTGSLTLDWGILVLMMPATMAGMIGWAMFRRKRP
ncbi:MAG: SCO family protein [Bdellovibrionales bacterium]|nr:SCO family protein [Bdellovibrionales bacterium]